MEITNIIVTNKLNIIKYKKLHEFQNLTNNEF